MKLCAVVYMDVECALPAQALAQRFSVACVNGQAVAEAKPKHRQQFFEAQVEEPESSCLFVLDAEGLHLHALGAAYGLAISADFHGPTTTYRRKQGGGKGQMIAKAVGLRSGVTPKVLDATAGLGGDAFVLASLGCEVKMLERVPAVRALLMSGLAQAKGFAETQDPVLAGILQRMQLVEADSLRYLKNIQEVDRPDVIYLDPMFPERTKRAMVKKEMRVFHELVGADPDADQLLSLALVQARYRVVVKRPRIAPSLNDQAPNHVLEGKSNRYDVYTIQKMPDHLGRQL